MSFFGELGRRNVFRVSIAYTIVSWIVVAAWTEFERRMARQLEDLRRKDKPAFEF
jgi:hypothetical protein